MHQTVLALNGKVKPITEEQKVWAFANSGGRYAARTKNRLFCLECGCSWLEASTLASELIGVTCPQCIAKIKVASAYKAGYKECDYVAVIDRVKDLQVVRMLYVQKRMKKGQAATYTCTEVMRHWIDASGDIATMTMDVNSMSMYYDQWIMGSDLKLRQNTGSYRCENRHGIAPNAIYPKCKVITPIKRNGFKSRLYGIAPHEFFSMLLKYPMFETLLKAGQSSLLKYFSGPVYQKIELKELWPVIRICIRNQYKVTDASMWVDYIHLLKQFGKDLMNPCYVCPSNLKDAHDKLVAKKQAQDKKNEVAELRARIYNAQEKYHESKNRFFDLAFDEGDISIRPLKTVEEFMHEGDELKHCVFTNAYYERDDSLVLTARIDTKPIETIEVSLSKKSILQARGFQNKASAYHDRIINIVQKNMSVITQRL